MAFCAFSSSRIRLLAGGLLLGLGGCIEAYLPDVVNAPARYLVVDGFLNGNGRTRIRLSRTENVAATTAPPPETGAQLTLLDEAGRPYPLTEASPGFYQSDSLLLPAPRRYQLRIVTGKGTGAATYESDLTPLKLTPPLDKFAWTHQDGQVQLRLSTHDPTGNSRFYRWGLTETWEFNSAYKSLLECIRGVIRSRVTPIYTCWHTDKHSTITQRSTASLSQDALINLQVLSFSDRAERIKIRYSILLTQYAESPEEFAYLEILRKNTEAVGTVNDPLPAQLTGNVHRTGTSTQEPVLGFVGAHTVVQQRLFITPQDLALPRDWAYEDPYAGCFLVKELVPDPEDHFPNIIHIPYTRTFCQTNYIPVEYGSVKQDTVDYVGSMRDCVDCRVRGSNIKPTFW